MALMGFVDLTDRQVSLDAKRDPLVEIDATVPWEEFRPELERVWRKPELERKSRAGRKLMDAVVMFKTLVLSALYSLSDDKIECQVRDRLSFIRFLGLGPEDQVPGAKTVWLYREGLAKAGMVEGLFKQFDGYLSRQGFVARGGQLLYASIVPARRNHKTREENKAIKNGEVPEGWADIRVVMIAPVLRRKHNACADQRGQIMHMISLPILALPVGAQLTRKGREVMIFICGANLRTILDECARLVEAGPKTAFFVSAGHRADFARRAPHRYLQPCFLLSAAQSSRLARGEKLR